jgi:hypothetical protein
VEKDLVKLKHGGDAKEAAEAADALEAWKVEVTGFGLENKRSWLVARQRGLVVLCDGLLLTFLYSFRAQEV